MSAPVVGIVGQGAVADVHAAAWRRIGVPLAVYAPSGAEDFADRWGAVSVPSPAALFDVVDVVDVCSPTHTHAELVRSAIAAGCDVICEKPLALDADTTRELVRLARDAGRRLLPAHVVRYFDAYELAFQAVAAGRLGALAVLRFTRSGTAPQTDWYLDDARSGGIIADQMIHDIDQALRLAGEVVRVYAVTAQGDGTRTAHVTLTHASGAISLCRGHWGGPGTVFRYGFDIAGTGGTLSFDSAVHTGISISTQSAVPDARTPIFPDLSFVDDPYEVQLRDFLGALTDGREPRATGADAVAAAAVVSAAIASARRGEAVTVPHAQGVHP